MWSPCDEICPVPRERLYSEIVKRMPKQLHASSIL